MINPDEIRRRREQQQLSQPEAAQRGKLKGNGQAWSNIEGGRVKDVRLSTLLALARGLKCSIADLVTEEYPPKPTRKRRTP